MARLLTGTGRLLRCLFALCVIASMAACSSSGRDSRYLHSEQRPALKIPAGLATPSYSTQMKLPAAAGQSLLPADGQPIDSSFDLERPPTLADTE